MDKTIVDTLILQALRQAILWRSPPKNLICHSDRGVQYAGNDFEALLAQYEITGSMSKKGDCWDNAVAKEFLPYAKRRAYTPDEIQDQGRGKNKNL